VFEAEGEKFRHTAASRLLRTDDPLSMRAFVISMGCEIDWKSFELLEHTIQTGQPAAERVSPGGYWEYLSKHPKVGETFGQAMTARSHGLIAGVMANYDFSRFRTVADIGGGRGHLLRAVIEAAPNVEGVLFDQPHVVGLLSGKIPGRIRLQGGDFFKDAMPQADAYMIHGGDSLATSGTVTIWSLPTRLGFMLIRLTQETLDCSQEKPGSCGHLRSDPAILKRPDALDSIFPASEIL
jgi:hypothetical protein